MMNKWKGILSVLTIVLLAACVSPMVDDRTAAVSPVTASQTPSGEATSTIDSVIEDLGAVEELDLEAMAAENNRLFEQLQSNTPIQVASANASARTITLTIPTLF